MDNKAADRSPFLTNASLTKDVVGKFRSVTTGQTPESVDLTVQKIQALAELPEKWDGYNGKPPTTNAFGGAIPLVYGLFVENVPAPDVFPVANGNLQIEWSCHGIDLEVEIASPNQILVYYHELDTGLELQLELTNDWTELGKLISTLAERNNPRNRMRIVA